MPTPGKRSVFGLFEIDSSGRKPAVVAAPNVQSSPAPREISSYVDRATSAPAAKASARASTAVSPRIEDIVKETSEKIPETNAVMLLMRTEMSLESAISDASSRRAAALSVLQNSQGITADKLAGDAASITTLVDQHLNMLGSQADAYIETGEIADLRRQATELTNGAEENRRKVVELQAQIEGDTSRAAQLEATASDKEAGAKDLKDDIESARAILHARYSV